MTEQSYISIWSKAEYLSFLIITDSGYCSDKNKTLQNCKAALLVNMVTTHRDVALWTGTRIEVQSLISVPWEVDN